jgi:hypothetical protein
MGTVPFFPRKVIVRLFRNPSVQQQKVVQRIAGC